MNQHGAVKCTWGLSQGETTYKVYPQSTFLLFANFSLQIVNTSYSEAMM